MNFIDLSSDTASLPSAQMRQVIAEAELGDEQKGEDPSVQRLLKHCCKISGLEDGIFLPSGTMANAIALKSHTEPGNSVFLDELSHILNSEGGGLALLAGLVPITIPTQDGTFRKEDFLGKFPARLYHFPEPSLLILEQTHNLGGGTVWPLEKLTEICTVAREKNLHIHLDGARIFNACVASGTDLKSYSSLCDSLYLDFSKGLSAPFGSVLLGSKKFIHKAKKYKHIFGGAMRQAGFMAAAALYALQNNISQLAEDHGNARLLSEELKKIQGIELHSAVQSNMVYFSVKDIENSHFLSAMEKEGIRFSHMGRFIRAVCYAGIKKADILKSAEITERVIQRVYSSR